MSSESRRISLMRPFPRPRVQRPAASAPGPMQSEVCFPQCFFLLFWMAVDSAAREVPVLFTTRQGIFCRAPGRILVDA